MGSVCKIDAGGKTLEKRRKPKRVGDVGRQCKKRALGGEGFAMSESVLHPTYITAPQCSQWLY